MSLPLELVSLILDHAAKSYSPLELSASFTCFSLVSSDWRALAQPILYARFTRYKQHYRSSPLIKTLLRHPHLRLYTKALWIDGVWFQGDRETKLLFESLLPGILEMGIWHAGYTHLLSSSTLTDVAMASNNLTSLCLQNLEDFPIDLFDHWIGLEELYVRNTIFSGFSRFTGEPLRSTSTSTTSTSQDPLPGHRPPLRLLQFDVYRLDEWSILAWLTHPECIFDLRSVKTLQLRSHIPHVGDNYDRRLLEVMNICAPSVEDLAVGPPRGSEQDDPLSSSRASLSRDLQKVRILRFRYLEYGTTTTKVSTISWIATFLSTVPHPEILEEVWIPGLLPNGVTENDDELAEGYRGFTALLTSSPFEKMRKLWISYHEPLAYQRVTKEEVEPAFRILLSGIYQTDRISIQFMFPQYGRSVMQDSEKWHYGFLN